MHTYSKLTWRQVLFTLPVLTLSLLAAEPSAVKVVTEEKTDTGTRVTLAIETPQSKSAQGPDGKDYTKLVLNGAGAENEVGSPALPVIHYSCEIPAGVKATVTTQERGVVEFDVKHPLWPKQAPVPKIAGALQRHQFAVDPEAYTRTKSTQYQKAKKGELTVTQYRQRGVDYLDIKAQPFAYHAQKGKVRFPTKLVLDIAYAPASLPKAAGPRLGTITVVRVELRDKADLETLQRNGYNFELRGTDAAEVYATTEELQTLKAEGLPFQIIGQQPGPGSQITAESKVVLGYHDYPSLTTELQQFSSNYTSLCRLTSIGQSVQGREMWAMKITTSPDQNLGKPKVRIAAAMHGDERMGPEVCLHLVKALLSGSQTNARLSNIVASTELWVLPMVNPDGVQNNTRFNNGGYDLNRSFPDGSSGTLGNPVFGPAPALNGLPPEVANLIRFATNHNFTLAANLHGGALVVNYPYDDDDRGSVDSPTPDDLLFENISRAYSSNNPPMWASTTFAQGIVNGAAWYSINGGLQDWSYRYAGCNEVTVEIGDEKQPATSLIPTFCDQNYESLLSYIETVQTGIHGRVTNTATGNPVYATVKLAGIDHLVFSDASSGGYHRMALPGSYSLIVSAPGCATAVISNVSVSAGQSLEINVGLDPAPRQVERILLVTSQTLSNSLAALQTRKEADGFAVQTLVVPDNSTTNTVRTAIRNAFATFPAEYIILVGDVERIPSFKDDGHATDLPYALMDAGEWFANYLGKDAVLGRISLKTAAELTNYVQKLNAFAAAPASRAGDITWVSGGANDSENNQAERAHEYCINNAVPNGYGATLFYRNTGSASDLTAHINAGTGGVIYSGHGEETGWYRYGYNLAALGNLNNTAHVPIVFGHCCLAGSFDLSVCFAEGWLQTAARAVTYVGATDLTYWDEDEWMQDAEFDAMAASSGLSVGKAIDAGRRKVHQQGSSLARYYYTAYHVLGDPTVSLFSNEAQPVAIRTANLPPLSLGINYSIPFEARGGTPPYQWTFVSGQLPSNMIFNSSGTLSGTPSQEGVFQFTVQVSDSSPTTQVATATLNCSVNNLNEAFNVALDTTGWVWSSDGSAPWVAQTSPNHDGIDAVRSGAISHNQQSSLTTTVFGPGRLTFWWSVSSERGWDKLKFSVNNILQQTISGSVAWQSVTYKLPAGPHQLLWQYSKDGSLSTGSDQGWVDQVSLLVTNKPTLVMTTPAAGARVTNSVVFAGTATDALPIREVWVKVNEAPYAAANLVSNALGKVSWSLDAVPQLGTNRILAKAINWAGNESVVLNRSFTFVAASTLTLTRNGAGTITPNLNGARLAVGQTYSLTATPAPNNLLSNWISVVDGVTNVIGTAPRLAFAMQTNLTLVANFVTNRFRDAAGNYNGLFWQTNGVALATAGAFTLTTDSKQNFSGKLFLEGQTNAFSGVLDLAGTGTSKPVVRAGKSPLTVTVQLDLNASEHVSGWVNSANDGWNAVLLGDRIRTNLVARYAGKYTMVLPAPAGETPGGSGYAAITVSRTGLATASGMLGDAHLLTPIATSISTNCDWPFYAVAYNWTNASRGRQPAGMVIGWLNISNNLARHITGNLAWLKRGWTNGFYNSGFTNDVQVFGAAYVPNPTRTVNITNGVAILSNGNLPVTLTNNFTLANGNTFVNTDTNYALKLSVTPATGVFTGSFKNPANRNLVTPFSGVFVQDAAAGWGVFKGTNQTGSVLLRER